jgi:hypothetical protein
MAKNPHLSAAAASVAADALCAMLDGGAVLIYDGDQPATADTAVTTQTLLAEATFADPAFAAAVDGVATAKPIDSEADAPAGGEAAWVRCVTSGGDPVFDGSVGTSDADCILSSVTITAHQVVTISSCTYRQGLTP